MDGRAFVQHNGLSIQLAALQEGNDPLHSLELYFVNKILKFTIPQYINKRKEIKINPVPGLRGINLDVLIKSPTFKFSVAII